MSERTALFDRVVERVGGRRLGMTGAAVGSLATSLGGTGTRFVIQLLLARWLGATGFGLFVVGRRWGEMLSKIPDLGYQLASVKVLPDAAEHEDWATFRGFLRRATIETTAWSVVLTLVVAGGYVLLATAPETTVVAGIVLTVPLALNSLSRSYMQAVDQFVLGTAAQHLAQPVLFAVMFGACWLVIDLGPVSTLWVYIASMVGTLLLYLWLLRTAMPRRVTQVPPDETRASEWRRLGLRMYPGQIAIAVLNLADVLVAGAFVGAADAALYAVASRVAILGRIVNSGLESVVSPRIAAAHAAGRPQDIQAVVDSTIRISSLPTLGFAGLAALFAGPVLSIFGAEFVDATPVLWILLVGNVSNALTGPSGYVVSLTDQEKRYSAVMSVHATALVVLSILLAQVAGIIGIAVAVSAVTVSWNLALVVMARRSLGVRCYPHAGMLRRR